jgi:molybdopterin/thiamine biosynthesis adenylyltransferase
MRTSYSSPEFQLALVGAGALGSQICAELAQLPPGTLSAVTLIDPDTLDAGNLPASAVFREIVLRSGTGIASKSEALALHFGRKAPHIAWTALVAEIADVGWQQLRRVNLLITCTDSVISRVEAAFAARMLDLPMLDAGVHAAGRRGGRVSCYAAGPGAACYLCGLSAATRAAALEALAAPSLSCGTLPVLTSLSASPEAFGSIPDTAALLADRLEACVHATTSVTWRVEGQASEGPRGGPPEPLQLIRAADCPWHCLPRAVTLADGRPLRDAIGPGEILLLPWAIALSSLCGACGAVSHIPRRLGLLRRGALCPACRASAIEPQQVIDRIAPEDDVAGWTPSRLGLPRSHALPARRRIDSRQGARSV